MRASLQPDDFPVCDYPIRKPGKVTLFKTLLVWRRKITKLLNICFFSLDASRHHLFWFLINIIFFQIVFISGLPGAGKSSTARTLAAQKLLDLI